MASTGATTTPEIGRDDPRRHRTDNGALDQESGESNGEQGLFNGEALDEADPTRFVFVTATLEDCQAIQRAGLVATTCPGGLGDWRQRYDEQLDGLKVAVVVEDHHVEAARRVQKSAKGRARSVTVLPMSVPVRQWLADEGTSEGLTQLARDTQRPKRGGIRFLTAKEFIAPIDSPLWLIKDTLPNDCIVITYGAPGCFKTFFSLDMAMHIATGMESWHGHRVDVSGSVLYLVGESPRGVRQRYLGWCNDRNVDPAGQPFRALAHPVDLLDARWRDEVLFEVESMEPRPVLTVVDTLNRFSGGVNENDTESMTKFWNAVEDIRQVTQGCVLVVHHANKSGHLRGSSTNEGTAHTILQVVRDGKSSRVKLVREKVREASEVSDEWFRGECVDTTEVSMGEPVTTLTFRRECPPDTSVAKSPIQDRILECLSDTAGQTAGHLARALGVARSTAYDNVKLLVEMGYLERRGDGYYPVVF